MAQSPSHSALNTAAAALRWLWSGVWSRFLLWAGSPEGEAAIDDWVCGIFRRLDELLAQYRAGELSPVSPTGLTAVGAVPSGRDGSRQNRPEPCETMPACVLEFASACSDHAQNGELGADGALAHAGGGRAVPFSAPDLREVAEACGAAFGSFFAKIGSNGAFLLVHIVPVK